MKKNAQYILSEQNTTGTLTRLTRQRLIKLLAYLINDEYNGLASVKEIHSICESTIALFPCLADEAGGIVRNLVNLFLFTLKYFVSLLEQALRSSRRISIQ